MSRSPQRRQTAGLTSVFILLAVFSGSVAFAAAPISIREFKEMAPKYPIFAEGRTTLTLEGRRASSGGTLLKFENFDVRFRPVEGEFPLFRNRNANAQVRGYMVRVDGGFEFRVEQIEEKPSDLDRFKNERVLIDGSDPDALRDFAERVRERAAFYDDDQLRAMADAALARSIELRRRLLARDDAAGRVELAEELEGKTSKTRLAAELRHEAWRIRRNEIPAKKFDERRAFAESIRKELTGADKVLNPYPRELAADYQDDPLRNYADVKDEERASLHRLFYIETLLSAFDAKATADGRNGAEIAKLIEASIPERTDVAAAYRARAVEYRTRHAAELTREEVVAFAAELRAGKEAQKADQVLRDWLASRTTLLRRDGAGGLVRAASEYTDLLGDQETAATLLLEAAKQSPDSEEVAAALAKLGYEESATGWLSPAEVAARKTARESASTPDAIAIGMRIDDVVRILGRPDAISRTVSASQLHEIYIYRTGGSRLAVHFLRYSGDDLTKSRVVGQQVVP
ncbi:hypothetical protein [Stratiformator vulcanicus]|uniref:Uncharacterized protein n=1 Tax=Stratiformator vulcanicus TaxID=2527980 RepID=A0A517QYP7_9PLAN|nr:hypothetical protein [Stratiformator vulcanicus]QDT36761.1 hypothetical protein Pan189_11240 [Stratiformator vulcanicus]